MPGRALCGTSFTALRQSAFEWLDEHAGETPESALFLDETGYQRDAIEQAWRTEYNPLRLTVSSIALLGQRAYEELRQPDPDIGTTERRRLIEQALENADTPDSIDTPRQHADTISELFRRLEADGVKTASELETRLAETTCSAPQRELMSSAYQKYQELMPELAHPDAVPLNEKLATVAATERNLEDAFPHLDAVVISGLYDPTTVETALLERLAKHVPVLVVIPRTRPDAQPTAADAGAGGIIETVDDLGFRVDRLAPAKDRSEDPLAAAAARLYRPTREHSTPPEGLTWQQMPTPDREVSHLARQLRSRLATGDVTPDDILVLAPGLLSYRDDLTDTFDAYGIDHTYQVTVLLERTYVGQAIFTALSLCERPTSGQISELVANPLVSLPGIDPPEVAECHRHLYTTAVDRFISELDESVAGVETLLEHTERVKTAAPTELRPAVDALLEHLGVEDAIDALDGSTDLNVGYETRAFQQLTHVFDSVEQVCETVSPADPLSELTAAIEGVRVAPPRQTSQGQIEIVGLQDTPMADFEELYILGATAEHLAEQTNRPRFFQEIGEALDVFKPNEYRDSVRYRFGLLIANAERVHITTPKTTITDESLLVSPLVDELARVTGLEATTEIESERRGRREDLQRGIAGAGPDVVAAKLATARENGHISAGLETATTRGVECASNRAKHRPTEHDGHISATAKANLHSKLDQKPFSPSRMNSYAKCGFKYLLRYGWGFEADDEIEPGISPLVVGQIIHDSIEIFYLKLQDQTGGDKPIDLTTVDRTALEELLLEAGQTAVADTAEEFTDPFAEATLYRLFAGLATSSENDHYAPEGASDPPSGTFVQFLENELERAAESHRPIAFEESFGDDAGISLADGRHIPVHGVIDRLDQSADGELTIFDYKSSSAGRTRDRENNVRDGLDFQLPSYTLGAPTLRPDRPDLTPTDIAARYYIVNDDPDVTLRPPLSEQFEFDYDTLLTETVPERIQSVGSAIDAGSFQPAVVGADAANCEYCAFRDVCDVRHHRRYDVIDAIDDTETDAYVPDGARSQEIANFVPGSDADE